MPFRQVGLDRCQSGKAGAIRKRSLDQAAPPPHSEQRPGVARQSYPHAGHRPLARRRRERRSPAKRTAGANAKSRMAAGSKSELECDHRAGIRGGDNIMRSLPPNRWLATHRSRCARNAAVSTAGRLSTPTTPPLIHARQSSPWYLNSVPNSLLKLTIHTTAIANASNASTAATRSMVMRVAVVTGDEFLAVEDLPCTRVRAHRWRLALR